MRIFPSGMISNKKLNILKYKINSFDNVKIKLYVIKPKQIKENAPVAIIYHGGGFVFESAPHHHYLAKKYALENNIVTIFVNYRLAYNHQYNTTLNDCLICYKWVIDNKNELSIDINNLILIGDSAGGFLSLKTSLFAYKNNWIVPKSLVLIYPVIDCSMRSETMKKYLYTPVWNAKLNKKMWEYYLNGNEEKSLLDEDFSFLKNVYIETSEIDCLNGEGKVFFDKLVNYNINTILNETKATMHGFDIKQTSRITKEAVRNRNDFIKNTSMIIEK